MKNLCLALGILLLSTGAFGAPEVLFENYKIHTVKTSDQIGLRVLELLGKDKKAMATAVPMVLMHGFTSNWNSWHLLADHYRQAGLRVFLVNWRGHGQGAHRSLPLDTSFDTRDPRFSFYNLPAIDVPTVIDFAYQISGKRKVIYHSHSMGGMMANLAFAGVSRDHDGTVIVSEARARDLEKKVRAYVPVAAPNSLTFKEYPGANYFIRLLNLVGIHGDTSGRIQWPLEELRHRGLYRANRATGLLNGLVNLDQMDAAEFSLFLDHCASDVPRSLSAHVASMQQDGFYGSEDRSVDFTLISQARPGARYYRTRIPTLMISAVTDVLALIDQQDDLALRRGNRHVRLPAAGHIDILMGTAGAQRVVAETLKFVSAH